MLKLGTQAYLTGNSFEKPGVRHVLDGRLRLGLTCESPGSATLTRGLGRNTLETWFHQLRLAKYLYVLRGT